MEFLNLEMVITFDPNETRWPFLIRDRESGKYLPLSHLVITEQHDLPLEVNADVQITRVISADEDKKAEEQ